MKNILANPHIHTHVLTHVLFHLETQSPLSLWQEMWQRCPRTLPSQASPREGASLSG